MDTNPVLLYDGVCPFCAWAVRFFLRHDRRRIVRFAPLDGSFGRAVQAAFPELKAVDSVVWVERDAAGRANRVFIKSRAVLKAVRQMGGIRRLALVFALLPKPLLDSAYEFVAKRRQRLVGNADSCFVPPPEERHRFL